MKTTPPYATLKPNQPPAVLDAYGKQVWKQTLRDLEAENRPLSILNRQILIGLCQATSDAKRAGDLIEAQGITIDGGREGTKRNPAVALRLQALALVRGFAKELGLSPASCHRLPPVPPELEFNEFEAV